MSFPPEDALKIDASTFERTKDSPVALRQAALGQQHPVARAFQAIGLLSNPSVKAVTYAAEAGSAMTGWQVKGQPDSITESGAMPNELHSVQQKAKKLAKHLEKASTRRATAYATPEQREHLMNQLEMLRSELNNLSGVCFVGGELNELWNAIGVINTFMTDFGLPRSTEITLSNIGTATMLFGRQADVHQVSVYEDS